MNQMIVPKPNRLGWGVGGEGTQSSTTAVLHTETRHAAWVTVSCGRRMEVEG